MFYGIAEHEGRKTELANAIFFFMKLLIFSTVFFFLIYLYLTI